VRVWMMAAVMLAGCATGAAWAQPSSDAAFERAVKESNECLVREVSSRVGKTTLTLTAGERSAVSNAAADACYIYNGILARFTREYHEKTRSLEDLTKVMLDGSLQLADQLIDAQLAENAKAQGR
jgi:hypothetical protein